MADKQILLITGANTGIGYEAVKALLRSSKPYRIFVGSRTLEKSQNAIDALVKEFPSSQSTLEPVAIELESDESIAKAFEVVSGKVDHIDTLINNAGAAFDTPDFASDLANARTIFNKAFDVNVTGTHIVTATFAPLLIKSASPRLLFLTSGLSTLEAHSRSFYPDWAPKPQAGWPKRGVIANLGYKSSKTALNMVMLNWHWLLKEDGVRTFCISPGFLATGLGGAPEMLKAMGAGDPAIGGEFIRRVAEGERDADAGKVVTNHGTQPW
ncbi:NAD(P)-binding protein [Trichoderma citrinoviride]|uniref:NAD(P)-binding protein n=1 Tax=Trichoderma citrinoviride TaxID=58853 RepID=A0A2T4B8X2_9HYPO|nr:NAD(P)-binding protein [Trichoderma citrinoviride]PTB65775.1 NAD(P)-binding protein [Trichoderma citrinoviride]